MTLPEPVGRQREVVALPPQGHFVVLGTAGSGKTTMSVHRAAHLGDARTDHAGPTLLLTFNRALLAYFEHLGAQALPDVTVLNYHTFARGYLGRCKRTTRSGAVSHLRSRFMPTRVSSTRSTDGWKRHMSTLRSIAIIVDRR